MWEQVQEKIERRGIEKGNVPGNTNKYKNRYPLTGMLYGSKCGVASRRRTWNSKLNCKKIVWQCSNYIKMEKIPVCCYNKVYERSNYIYEFSKGFVDRQLPEGFSLITLESADLHKLKLCTHRGFKNDGEPEKGIDTSLHIASAPHFVEGLGTAIQAPNGEPVFLTKNGRGRYVLVDIEEYERQQTILKLLTKLNEAEETIKTGKEWQTLDDVKSIRRIW